MKIKWLHVIRDVIIITICYFIGGYIVSYATEGYAEDVFVLIYSSALGSLGFCLSACFTPKDRWRYLRVVTIGVWLTVYFPFLIITPYLVTWLLSVLMILIMMFTGGALSFIFVKSPQKIDPIVDEIKNSPQ